MRKIRLPWLSTALQPGRASLQAQLKTSCPPLLTRDRRAADEDDEYNDDEESNDPHESPDRPRWTLVKGQAAPGLQLAAEASYLLAVLHSAHLVAQPASEANITRQLQARNCSKPCSLASPPCALDLRPLPRCGNIRRALRETRASGPQCLTLACVRSWRPPAAAAWRAWRSCTATSGASMPQRAAGCP